MPHNTIRRAVRLPTVYGKTFVQSDLPGFASYHFLANRATYISYEADECSRWMLDDGTPLPSSKSFADVSYDMEARVFKGTIDWSPTSFCGDERWEYEMHFDEAVTRIHTPQ